MPRPIPPYPPSEPFAATLAPLLADYDQRDLFHNINEPAYWTLPLIRAQNDLSLAPVIACRAQLWLITTLGIPNRWDRWAILAATRALGAVDTSSLGRDCLTTLLLQAGKVASILDTVLLATADQVAMRITAAKAASSYPCATARGIANTFLDRVGDRLIAALHP